VDDVCFKGTAGGGLGCDINLLYLSYDDYTLQIILLHLFIDHLGLYCPS
jgi:hypothetical protein